MINRGKMGCLLLTSFIVMTGYGFMKMVCVSQQDYVSTDEYRRLAQAIVQQNMTETPSGEDNCSQSCIIAK